MLGSLRRLKLCLAICALSLFASCAPAADTTPDAPIEAEEVADWPAAQEGIHTATFPPAPDADSASTESDPAVDAQAIGEVSSPQDIEGSATQPSAGTDETPSLQEVASELQAGQATGFGLADVEQKARDLAAQPFSQSEPLPEAAAQLNYDQYRRIQNTSGYALFDETSLGYRLKPDPRGYLFADEVKINIIDETGVQARAYSPEAFDFLDLPLSDEIRNTLGFSGFRALSPINQAGKFDEVISFRGASFFRALGAGAVYGASARGLSIGTASSEGEEFPHFTEFWIAKPEPGDRDINIYALLDGKSVTGAYKFEIEPGPDTKVRVSATIYPRRNLSNIGIAPLTSMYYFSPQDVVKPRSDFRPAVHDSEGLAFHQQNGEWVWRPLSNPKELQVSVLSQDVPLGFGLIQRKRQLDDYADIEANYQSRPSVWIEPVEGWQKGRLTLIEIPTTNEYNDNIVVFWSPDETWVKGSEHRISYTQHWSLRPPALPDVIAVADTMAGTVPGTSEKQIFVIDFDLQTDALAEELEASLSASAGAISNSVIRRFPGTGMTRLSFELDPKNAQSSELRALLTRGGKPVTETWIYRWRRQ